MDREKIAGMLEILVEKDFSKDEIVEFARQVVSSPEEVFDLLDSTVASLDTSLESRIHMILNELCIPQELEEYKYLTKAVELVCKDATMLNGALNYHLYPAILHELNITGPFAIGNLKESITRAVDHVWDKMDKDVKTKYFGDRAKNEIINNENFIKELADYLRSNE